MEVQKYGLYALCAFFVLGNPVFAASKARHGGDLTTGFSVEKVRVSKENALSSFSEKYVSCGDHFEGTQGGNKLYIRVSSQGGRGRIKHVLSYSLSEGYELEAEDPGLHEIGLSGDGLIKVQLPRLRNDVPFVQQNFYLLTEDSQGNRSSSSKLFTVSHPIRLMKAITKQGCYERYEAKEASPIMTNQTTSLSQIDIKQTIERNFGKIKNQQFGVFINPIVGFPPGFLLSLFSLNYGLFHEVSKQMIEITDFTQQFTLNPGDNYQIFRQDTRVVNAYDGNLIGPCGELTPLPSAYMVQSWMHAFHAIPIDPVAKTGPVLEAIGGRVENTCPEEFNLPTIHQQNANFHGIFLKKE